MRTLLLAIALTALVLPIVTYRDVRTGAPARGDREVPDQVLVATQGFDLSGCPEGWSCDMNRLEVTIAVGPKALVLMVNGDPVQSIARDGREWERLRAAELPLARDFGDLMVRLDEGGTYEDLLEALLITHAAGFPGRIANGIQPRSMGTALMGGCRG
jgi:hypothetical protein